MAGKKSKPRSILKNRRGQSIVLVAIMILSFLMFFTFALNTGLLIHAKISVQSAADAAAYAGAATQGRYLNSISFLNYDMRRQYKKFLFRNAFVGALGSPKFPINLPGNQATGRYSFSKLDFSGNVPQANTKPLRVPVVCVPLLTQGMNFDRCQQLNMRNTENDIRDRLGVLPGGGSSIIQALIQSTQNLQNSMEKTCVGQSGINEAVLISWLFKGENSINYVQSIVDQWFSSAGGAANQNKNGVMELVQGLVKGLGLYPRNFLTQMRIETLVQFINTPPQSVDLEQVEASEQSPQKAERMERTILAFKSALSNLNQDVFDPSLLQMEELQPAEMLKIEPLYAGSSGGTGGNQNTGLNVFYQASKFDNSSGGDATTFCKSYAQQITLQDIPVGVKLIPIARKNVIYAVKLRAFIKPRGLLFAPWSDNLELTAMAGAKPFGSRIGPAQIQSSSFGEVVDMNGVTTNDNVPLCVSGLANQCPVPNLEVGAGKTFFDTEFLAQMHKIATGGSSSSYTLEGVLKAQYHAMAPNPTEVGRYGIIPQPPAVAEMRYQFIPFFDAKSVPQNGPDEFKSPIYRFYAPIFPADQTSPMDLLQRRLEFLRNQQPSLYGFNPETTYQTALQSMQNYITSALETGVDSENQESRTFAAIELPMYNLVAPEQDKFWLTQKEQVLSSWAPRHIKSSPSSFYSPRFGYSVKHVALRELLSEGLTSMDDEIESVPH